MKTKKEEFVDWFVSLEQEKQDAIERLIDYANQQENQKFEEVLPPYPQEGS